MMPFDIGQCLTHAVQYIAADVLNNGLTFSFDVSGARLLVHAAEEPFSRTFHRLLRAGVDILESGLLLIQAEGEAPGAFRLRIGGLGHLASDARLREVLARLELPVAAGSSWQLHALGVCHITGATVDFVADHREGFVLDAVLTGLPALPQSFAPLANAPRAWVFGPVPGPTSLVRRLVRLGWKAQAFEPPASPAEVLAQWAEEPPQVLIALQGASGQPGAFTPDAMRLPWPAGTRLILGVPRGSPILRGRRAELAPWEVWATPFGPLELERLTAAHQPGGDCLGLAEAPTAATPASPRLLIVDDNPTNRLLASAAARLWGYQPVLAEDGRQALDRCIEAPPDGVLMDIDMPTMDGLTATRVLRAWQGSGRLLPFPILAVTADTTNETRQACLAAGMEVVLHKPLIIDEAAAALRQLCPQAPAA